MQVLDLERLRHRLNKNDNHIHLLAFLSPTCIVCRYGGGVVRAIFEELDDPRLEGSIVWVPILSDDNETTAKEEVSAFSDARIQHFWDRDRASANAFSETLGLSCPTWDTYLVYGGGRGEWRVGEAPPPATCCMYQLPRRVGADERLLLHPATLGLTIAQLLGEGAEAVKEDLGLRLHAKGISAVHRERSTGRGFDPIAC